jgi:tetratricopeptide (TPR) repeat protein
MNRTCGLRATSEGLHDVLEVQAEVARAVAREIQIKLTPHEQRRLDPDKTRSINPQAYELYLRGRHFWYRRTEEGIRKSIECFEEALRHDPSFAAAYDGISDAHKMLACRGMTPALESFHKARAAARQAVRIQPELGEGYASLAHVRLHDWDWVGLETDFRRAVELDPDTPSHTTGTRNISWRWAGAGKRSVECNTAGSWIRLTPLSTPQSE